MRDPQINKKDPLIFLELSNILKVCLAIYQNN